MIISKTPLRMSFVGGGSDLKNFYREEVGAVISTSIDKYMYICINKKFDDRIRVSYTHTEDVERCEDVKHPLVREALQLVGIKGGIEIASMADIPSSGTGLGSSSAYTVGLLNALYAYTSRYVSKEKLAGQACEIEIDRCGEPIGKQDQYAAAYGGLNLIRFQPDESVIVEPIICERSTLQRIEDEILVFFTGRTRSASAILSEQSASMQSSKYRSLIRRMVELVFIMKESIESSSIDCLGELLDENWRLKSQLNSAISDSEIDGWYLKGVKAGAHGGKLLGAGNGGFLMFYAPVELHQQIIKALSDLRPVKFRFDNTGTQVVFYQSHY